jgi:glutathione S-transferase
MDLYDNPFSPYAFKVRAALYEKGIAHEKHEIRTHADREILLRVNPRGEVPALADGDAVICDSKVICAYLEERHPDPALYPRDLELRARCRYLELKSDNEIDACVFVLGIIKLTRPELAEQLPGALSGTDEALARHYDYLERELAGREWFLGEFSLVDIALTPHLRSAAFMGYPPR